jgi:ABC-2 type transport system ATP-binding protein
MDFAIETHGLKKKFRRVNAVDGLDLEVPRGSIYALVGPNGAGKTTAIKILMNIIRPTSGKAKVLGQDSFRVAGKSFCSIGYVSENQQMPAWMRVDSLLAYLRPFYPTWDRDLETELVKKFELPLDRKLKQLSRGMRMKAALASALAYRPKLIVLDEPLGGLDPLVRDELIEGLLERAAESTIFISSHDLAEIETFASHAGYMEQGRLRFSEEMGSLAGRFREVELAFDAPPALPPKYPETWMQVETSGSVVKFIASRFDEQGTKAEIHQFFAGVRDMTFVPMSLRAIFLAMAKSRRTARTAASTP